MRDEGHAQLATRACVQLPSSGCRHVVGGRNRLPVARIAVCHRARFAIVQRWATAQHSCGNCAAVAARDDEFACLLVSAWRIVVVASQALARFGVRLAELDEANTLLP